MGLETDQTEAWHCTDRGIERVHVNSHGQRIVAGGKNVGGA